MIPLHPKNLFPIKITPVDGEEIDVSNLENAKSSYLLLYLIPRFLVILSNSSKLN